MNIYDTLDQFIEKLITKSTPESPLWHIEKSIGSKKIQWNYIDGCMTTSLVALYKQTKNEKYLNFLKSWTDFYINDDGTIKGYDFTHYSTDDASQSRILFDLYEITKDPKLVKAIHHTYKQIDGQPRTKEGNFWHKLIYPNQVWLDGLYMMHPFYVRYETMFNNKKGYSDTINQFENVRRLMFDVNKKLYYHCYDESRKMFWCNKDTGLSPHFWLRATGWYVAALSDVAFYMDDLKGKTYLKGLLKETIDGLLLYQDKDSKMFWQIVDLAGKEKNYLETSGSLLIAYSILKATNNNLLPKSYQKIGLDIFESVCKLRLTNNDGDLNLEGICLVAGLGPENNLRRDGTYEYYMSEPIVKNDAKGVGPLVMTYVEALISKSK